MLKSARARLLGRAITVLITVAITAWTGLDPAQQAAATAAVTAILEVLTPLNALVGPMKKPDAVKAELARGGYMKKQ